MPHLRSPCAAARRSARALRRGFVRRRSDRCLHGGAAAPRQAWADLEDGDTERQCDPLFDADPWARPPDKDPPRVGAPPALRAAAPEFCPIAADPAPHNMLTDVIEAQNRTIALLVAELEWWRATGAPAAPPQDDQQVQLLSGRVRSLEASVRSLAASLPDAVEASIAKRALPTDLTQVRGDLTKDVVDVTCGRLADLLGKYDAMIQKQLQCLQVPAPPPPSAGGAARREPAMRDASCDEFLVMAAAARRRLPHIMVIPPPPLMLNDKLSPSTPTPPRVTNDKLNPSTPTPPRVTNDKLNPSTPTPPRVTHTSRTSRSARSCAASGGDGDPPWRTRTSSTSRPSRSEWAALCAAVDWQP
jgi:hypothetical protein